MGDIDLIIANGNGDAGPVIGNRDLRIVTDLVADSLVDGLPDPLRVGLRWLLRPKADLENGAALRAQDCRSCNRAKCGTGQQ